MHRDHLHGASRRCRSGAAESTGVDQSLTSTISSSALSGAQVGGLIKGQSRTCRQRAGRHSTAHPQTVRARRSPSLRSFSNPIAGLAPRFGPKFETTSAQHGSAGRIIWPILSDRSGAAKDPGRHRFVQFDWTDAAERMHKFLDTTHRKPLLPLHLQVQLPAQRNCLRCPASTNRAVVTASALQPERNRR